MISRDIPADVERQLRQEAGFGCCVCGHPFYEYHHIIEFSSRPHHNPTDMMVLCPNHHHEATVEAITVQQQRSYKNSPYNIQKGFTEGLLVNNQDTFGFELGGNQIVGKQFKLVVDDVCLFSISLDDNNRMLFNMLLYDENDKKVLEIIKNKWVSGDYIPWDIEFGFRWIKLRKKARDISLFLDMRNFPITVTGKMWRNGCLFKLSKNEVKIDNLGTSFSVSNLGLVGCYLKANTISKEISLEPDPNTILVSGPDSNTRFIKAFIEYTKLSKKFPLTSPV